MDGGLFVREVRLKPGTDAAAGYPLGIPAIRNLGCLRFETPVTFLVGENGSGKSTLVEALAVACGFNAEGGSRNFSFSTRATAFPLLDALEVARGVRRPRTGYFLRAESYFNVATQLEELDRDVDDAGRPLIGPKVTPAYGKNPHERSHGESFADLLRNRFSRDGLYLLDEPEAAMSPRGCLLLLRRMGELTAAGSQFIVATHSPILMAFPGARIHVLTDDGPVRVPYDEVDHVQLTRDFLTNPEVYVHHLFEEPR